jgi:hypothetical protein
LEADVEKRRNQDSKIAPWYQLAVDCRWYHEAIFCSRSFLFSPSASKILRVLFCPKGQYPLMESCDRDDFSSVNALIMKGADPSVSDHIEDTVLPHALRCCVALLSLQCTCKCRSSGRCDKQSRSERGQYCLCDGADGKLQASHQNRRKHF